jgi:MFS transporter, DHA1 family, multidrug resistance protein
MCATKYECSSWTGRELEGDQYSNAVTIPAFMLSPRLRNLALLALLSAAGPLALNAYVPLLPGVQKFFLASQPDVQATVSFGLVAYALGMLGTGPLIDCMGHRAAILVGLVAYCVGNLCCLFGPSLQWLVMGRVLASAGAAVGWIGSRAICAELFSGEQLRSSVAQLMMISVNVSVFAPMLGTALSAWQGWRTVFIFLCGYALLLFALCWSFLPKLPHHAHAQHSEERQSKARVLTRPAYLVPVSMFVLYYMPYIVFVSLAPFLLENFYDQPTSMYAKLFPLLIIAYFLGNFLVSRIGSVKGSAWLVRNSMLLVIGGFVLAFTLVLMDWRNPLAIFLPYATLGFAHGLAMPSLSAQAIDASRPHTALGWGLLGFSQQTLGGVCVQLMGFSDTHSPWPVLLFGSGATVLFALLYWKGWDAKAK